MKSLIAVLCVIALIANTYSGYTAIVAPDVEDIVDDDNDNIDDIGNITVRVPDQMIFDVAEYDYTFHFETYSEDKNSGEIWHNLIELDGTVMERTPDIHRATDAYGKSHPVLRVDSDTQAQLTWSAEATDWEGLTLTGAVDIQRYDYYELNTKKVIQSETGINLTTDMAIPTANGFEKIGVAGKLRTFSDPHMPREETIEEKIYGGGVPVTLGDRGSVIEDFWQAYNWTAEAAERVSGYDSLRINLTLAFTDNGSFWEMPLFRQIWISSDVPKPVKYYSRMYIPWDDENGTGFNLIEIDRTLKTGGYTRGTKEIPWNLDSGNQPFGDLNILGEYEQWNYIASPGDGFGSHSSSFDYSPLDAIDFAKQSSTGNGSLTQFFDFYDTPSNPLVVVGAEYNATKNKPNIEDRSGTYGWTLTFAHRDPGLSEWDYGGWNKTYRYSVEVQQDWEKVLLSNPPEYTITDRMVNDYGYHNGSAERYKSDYPSEILTFSGCENILKSDAETKRNVYNQYTNKIDWGSGGTNFYMEAGEGGFSLGILETLTGFTLPPTPSNSWTVQKGSLFEDGETYMAVIDGIDGKLAYAAHVTSNMPLELLLSGGN